MILILEVISEILNEIKIKYNIYPKAIDLTIIIFNIKYKMIMID